MFEGCSALSFGFHLSLGWPMFFSPAFKSTWWTHVEHCTIFSCLRRRCQAPAACSLVRRDRRLYCMRFAPRLRCTWYTRIVGWWQTNKKRAIPDILSSPFHTRKLNILRGPTRWNHTRTRAQNTHIHASITEAFTTAVPLLYVDMSHHVSATSTAHRSSKALSTPFSWNWEWTTRDVRYFENGRGHKVINNHQNNCENVQNLEELISCVLPFRLMVVSTLWKLNYISRDIERHFAKTTLSGIDEFQCNLPELITRPHEITTFSDLDAESSVGSAVEAHDQVNHFVSRVSSPAFIGIAFKVKENCFTLKIWYTLSFKNNYRNSCEANATTKQLSPPSPLPNYQTWLARWWIQLTV